MFNFELVTFPILSSSLWLVPAILINIAHVYHPYVEFLRGDIPKAEYFSKAMEECCHVVVLWAGAAAPACGRMAPSRKQREACTLPTDMKDASGFAWAVDSRIVQSSFYLFTRYIYQIVMLDTGVCTALPLQRLWPNGRRTSVNFVGGRLTLVVCHRRWGSALVASGSHCCLVMCRHMNEQGVMSRNAMRSLSFPGKSWIMSLLFKFRVCHINFSF